jgi:hypothetical protein
MQCERTKHAASIISTGSYSAEIDWAARVPCQSEELSHGPVALFWFLFREFESQVSSSADSHHFEQSVSKRWHAECLDNGADKNDSQDKAPGEI